MGFNANAHVVLGELEHVLDLISEEDVDRAIALIEGSDKIFFNALGRAANTGKSFVMRLMHMGREVYVLGETNTPNFGAGDLLVVCSGSGETKQFIDTATKAKGFGGKLLLFTTNTHSTLAKMADAVIAIDAPSKAQGDSEFSSVQPMASLFEQAILVSGDAIVLTIMERSDADNDAMFSRHSNLE